MEEYITDEIRYYQPRFRRWINSKKWDNIAEQLSETSIEILSQIMKAQKDGDCSWIIWKQADYVLERIQKIAKDFK